jgi:cytochrome c oxidase assembly protein subunit 15
MTASRSARALSPLTLALLISQAALVVTGGAVRLTGSGLGCPTWPECTAGSYVPVKNQAEGTVHSWIEFTNRLLTFVLVLVALATLVAVLKAGRKDLRLLALGQFLGIFGQGVLGGITVLTHLNPISVASHFLLSIVLIAAATSLYSRRISPAEATSVAGTLNIYSRSHVFLTAAVVVLGTVVTGAGPHAGDINAPRLHIKIQEAATFHGVAVLALIAFTIIFYFNHLTSPLTKKRLQIFLVIALSQGLIGYVQYLQGVPQLLVATHLLGSTLVWIAAWQIWLSVQRKEMGIIR